MLNKRDVLDALLCEKAVYLRLHQPELATPVSDFVEGLAQQGRGIGELARQRFRDGVLIDVQPWSPTEAIRLTRRALDGGAAAVFEATFEREDVLIRADVVERDGDGYRLIEVKSTTNAQVDEHAADLAVQLWVCRAAGIPVKSAVLLHLDKTATTADPRRVFVERDLTPEVEAMLPDVERAVRAARAASLATAPPSRDIGPHCESLKCAFFAHCREAAGVPAMSALDLPRAGKKKWRWYRAGIVTLDAVPERELSDAQRRVRDAHLRSRRFIDVAGLRQGIAKWRRPLAHLDFETWKCAAPRFAGAHPHETIPVQFSLHVDHALEAPPTHHEYLHDAATDPRADVAAALARALAPCSGGSVVAYNVGTERAGLRSLANVAQRDEAGVLRQAANRLVDPLAMLRAHVYDPAFCGDFTLKVVAPALLGRAFSYEGHAVRSGTDAMVLYEEMIDPACAPDRKQNIRRELLRYCALDTWSTLHLVRWLESEAAKA
ncbi:MAG: DUF2779 domain-containing protein [Planctomycetes bacterium]|nr:DUF2779 domain-containing protein [Planctomycetota bacterium]